MKESYFQTPQNQREVLQMMARELEERYCPHGASNQACCVTCLSKFYGNKIKNDSENTLNPTFFGEQISKRNSDKNGPIKRLTKQEFGYTWD